MCVLYLSAALMVLSTVGAVAQTAAQQQAAPDGSTLLPANTSLLNVNPHTFSKLPCDAEKSFRPVSNFLAAAMVMAVDAANVPANSVAEFIAWAKPLGGKVSIASFTAGNPSHFAGVILNQRAGLEMVHVPFNGTPPAVQNLVGGQVHAAFLPRLAVKPHLDSGIDDLILSAGLAGTLATWLRPSLHDNGLDPDALPAAPRRDCNSNPSIAAKKWMDVWAANQSLGAILAAKPVPALVDRVEQEFAKPRPRPAGWRS